MKIKIYFLLVTFASTAFCQNYFENLVNCLEKDLCETKALEKYWPTTLQSENLLLSENNIFVMLQTLLILNRVDKFYPIFFLNDLNKSFVKSFKRFIDDVNLLNDTNTSSRLFLWMLKNNINHEHEADFLKMILENYDFEQQGFKTWINNNENFSNKIDCVVNFNIFTALKSYENKTGIILPKIYQDALNGISKNAKRWFDHQEKSQYNTRYFETLLAFSQSFKEDKNRFMPIYPEVFRFAVTKAVELVNNSNVTATEVAEAIITLQNLSIGKSENQTLIMLLRQKLKEMVIHDEDQSFSNSASIFTWEFSKAYSTALTLEALL